MSDGELKHYGVLGMRWGISRANTTGKLKRVAEKISSKNKKIKGKLAKVETRQVKIDKATASLNRGIKFKKASAVLNKLPGSRQHLARSTRRIKLIKRVSVKNLKKISTYKKQLIKNKLLSDVLDKKMTRLSPTSIQRGKSIIEGSTKREVKK